MAGENGQSISKELHTGNEWGTFIKYDIQPVGVTVWSYPDQVEAHREEVKPSIWLEAEHLRFDWSTPKDFIADFRQALESLVTNGDYAFSHLRERSTADVVGDAVGMLGGCLALLLLLWFAFCAAV